MVLRLGEALGVSLRERNQLLHAAGLPAAYPEAGLHGPELAPFRTALDSLLRADLPYPAMVLDRTTRSSSPTSPVARLNGSDLVGISLIRHFLADPAAQAIVYWPNVAWAGLDRLLHQRDRARSDQHLAELVTLRRLRRRPVAARQRWLRVSGGHPGSPSLCARRSTRCTRNACTDPGYRWGPRKAWCTSTCASNTAPEAVAAIPSDETLRTVWRDWFGPGGGRQRYLRSAALPTSGERVVVHRPGQVVALDTTIRPVKGSRDGIRRFGVGAPDAGVVVYTHSLVAFRLTGVRHSRSGATQRI